MGNGLGEHMGGVRSWLSYRMRTGLREDVRAVSARLSERMITDRRSGVRQSSVVRMSRWLRDGVTMGGGSAGLLGRIVGSLTGVHSYEHPACPERCPCSYPEQRSRVGRSDTDVHRADWPRNSDRSRIAVRTLDTLDALCSGVTDRTLRSDRTLDALVPCGALVPG